MPTIEDYVNQKLAKERELAAQKQVRFNNEQELRLQQEAQFLKDLSDRFQNDARYSAIVSIMSDHEIQDSVNFMFSKLTYGDPYDHKPKFYLPKYSEQALSNARRGYEYDSNFEDEYPEGIQTHCWHPLPFKPEVFIDEHMIGTISFDAGYYPSTGGGGGDDAWGSPSGYIHRFKLAVKANQEGWVVFRTDKTYGDAERQLMSQGIEKISIPGPGGRGGYYGWPAEARTQIEKMSWVEVASQDDVLELLSSELVSMLKGR